VSVLENITKIIINTYVNGNIMQKGKCVDGLEIEIDYLLELLEQLDALLASDAGSIEQVFV